MLKPERMFCGQYRRIMFLLKAEIGFQFGPNLEATLSVSKEQGVKYFSTNAEQMDNRLPARGIQKQKIRPKRKKSFPRQRATSSQSQQSMFEELLLVTVDEDSAHKMLTLRLLIKKLKSFCQSYEDSSAMRTVTSSQNDVEKRLIKTCVLQGDCIFRLEHSQKNSLGHAQLMISAISRKLAMQLELENRIYYACCNQSYSESHAVLLSSEHSVILK